MKSHAFFRAGAATAALAILVGTIGCASIAGGLGKSLGISVDDKTIATKVAPNILVAVDGSSCEVSKDRWERAKVGQFYICSWTRTRGRS